MNFILKIVFLFLLNSFYLAEAASTHWQLHYDHNILNANFVDTEARDIVYLIVHGTWAHQEMEIISSLQELLEEQEYSSLAVTLSIGVSNRSGFLSCDEPIYGTQDLAVEEIDAWVDALKFRGFEKIVLVAHSRGGAQAALYEKQHPGSVDRLALLAPMVWDEARVYKSYNARSHHRLETVLEIARTSGSLLIGPFPLVNCEAIQGTPASFLSYYGSKVEKHSPQLLVSSTIPVQVFLASEDQVARWTEQDKKLASSNALVSISTIDGSGHFFRDLYLDDVIDELAGVSE